VSFIGGEDTRGKYSFMSLSHNANKVIYVPETDKLVIRDLGSNRERTGYAALDPYNLVNTFIWSLDETKIVFAMVRNEGEYPYVSEDAFISMDYWLLDTATG
jgi:hypothetical protein